MEKNSANKNVGLLMVVGLILITVLVRIFYIMSFENVPLGPDSRMYLGVALNIAKFGHYSFDDTYVGATTFINPGYPLFLYVVLMWTKDLNLTIHLIQVFQAVFWGVIVYLLHFQLNKVIGSIAAFLACLLVCLSPHLIVISGYILTESWFAFWFVLSVHFFIEGVSKDKLIYLLLFALCAGIATLTRPVYILVPIILTIFMAFYSGFDKAKKIGLVSVLGLLLCLSPWSIWKTTIKEKHDQPNLVLEAFQLGSYPDFTFNNTQPGFPNYEDPNYKESKQSWASAFSYYIQRFKEEPSKHIKWLIYGKASTFWSWNMVQGAGGPFVYRIKDSAFQRYSSYSSLLPIYKVLHPLLVVLAILCPFIFYFSKYPANSRLVLFVSVSYLIAVYYSAVHVVLAPLPRYAVPFHLLCYSLAVISIVMLVASYRRFNSTDQSGQLQTHADR